MRVPTQSASPKNATDAQQRFRQFFGDRRPVLLSVIPVTTEEEALERVGAAQTNGADGIFLIGDGVGHQKVLRIARLAVERYPGFFVGVNCTDLRPQDVFCRLPAGVKGVWSYRSGIWPPDPDALVAVSRARRETGWQGLYFGGIPVPLQLERCEKAPIDAAADLSPAHEFEPALSSAIRHVDVITIGDLTGCEPPSPGILERLRRGVERCPLAIVGRSATGAVTAILAHADCILTVARPAVSDASTSAEATKKSDKGLATASQKASAHMDSAAPGATIRAPPTQPES